MSESVKALDEIDDAEIATEATSTQPLRLTWWRRSVQLISLAVLGQWSFYGIFRCPFIVPYISCESCPVITCHGRLFSLFAGFWILLPLTVIFFGRAFCGWICPAGFITQLLSSVTPFKLRTRSTIMRLLPYGKYIGLALVLAVLFLLKQPRTAIPIRVGDFFTSVALTFEHADNIWLIRTFIVIALLIAGVIFANSWCRFFCPTGGVLEIFKRFSFFKVYKTAACNGCNKCLRSCAMATRPQEANCTNCGDCLSLCPEDAIKIGRKSS